MNVLWPHDGLFEMSFETDLFFEIPPTMSFTGTSSLLPASTLLAQKRRYTQGTKTMED